MKFCSPDMATHLRQPTTTITTMWKITRMDGRVFTFTELDRDVTYKGLIYKSTGGFNKSAIKSTGTFSVDNLEVNGFLSDDTIPDDELRNGAFDYAEVEIFIINYLDPGMGEIKMRFGNFGEVKSAPSGFFLVELRGLIQMLAVNIGETYVPECKADLGDDRCKIKLIPDVWQSGTEYKTGDIVIAPFVSIVEILSPARLDILDPGFESGSLGNGWTVAPLCDVVGGNLNLDPYTPPDGNPEDNMKYIVLRGRPFRPTQTVSLIRGDSTGSAIDTGTCSLRLSVLAAALEVNSGASVQILFTNQANQTIESYTHDFGAQRPERFWRDQNFEKLIPIGARNIMILLGGYNDDSMGFMATCFDNIRADVIFKDPEVIDISDLDYRIYGGVEFVAQNSFKSGTETPPWQGDIGSMTPDDAGGMWMTSYPKHMMLGQVIQDAANASVFRTGGIGAAPGQLDWGVVQFLSGDNIGRSVEVQWFDSSTGYLRTVMPLPAQAKVGDRFRVHTGCDKSREVCFGKFQNIVNFRGEPDVPGLNQYFQVGGML